MIKSEIKKIWVSVFFEVIEGFEDIDKAMKYVKKRRKVEDLQGPNYKIMVEYEDNDCLDGYFKTKKKAVEFLEIITK